MNQNLNSFKFIFFSPSHIGSAFLQANIIQSLFVALAINGLTILQALHNSKQAVKYMTAGLLVKALLQYPLVLFAQGMGAIIATDVAFLTIIFLTYTNLKQAYQLDYSRLAPVFTVNIFFALVVLASHFLFTLVYIPQGKVAAFTTAAIIGSLAVIAYICLSDRLGTSRHVFGINLIERCKALLM